LLAQRIGEYECFGVIEFTQAELANDCNYYCYKIGKLANEAS
jgi:hypothetical protein